MEQILPTTATVIEAQTLLELAKSYDKLHLIGSGADKVLEITPANNLVAHGAALPSAKDMALISYELWNKQTFEDVAYFEPFYLKDFMAPLPKRK
jgi:tRNA threonylcarbamoyladenosine biosynthesis protein TsaB